MLLSALFIRLAVAVVAVTAAAHSPILSKRVVHEARSFVPQGWSLHRRADPDTLVPLKISLTQSNLHKLDEYLLEVSDPESENYGKHWTPKKVAEVFRPSQESIDTVYTWLVNDYGIHPEKVRLSPNGGALHLAVSIAEAESILGSKYYVYRRSEDGHERVAFESAYTLPEHISRHIDLVTPSLHLPASDASLARRVRKGKPVFERPSGAPKTDITESEVPTDASQCDTYVTLECLRKLYNFYYEPVVPQKNTIGVVEISDEVYQGSDLDIFFNKFSPSMVGERPTLVSITGGHLDPNETNTSFLGESTMDFELVMGLLGPKQNVSLYQIGESGDTWDEALVAAFDKSYCSQSGVSSALDCGNKPASYVVSISYHFEPDYPDPTNARILERVCAEYGKLSLTGMTFVVSSGDHGVAYGSQECFVNGTIVTQPDKGGFVGQFPASCPYVTAVGATQLAKNNTIADGEGATTDFPSGGGFSRIFGQPTYQKRAVSRYLNNYVPKSYGADVFNRTGRAYPDVSANGYPTVVALGGKFSRSGGTSAAAPIFASMIAAVNDARISVGKGPVGFINPAIYSNLFRGAFNDITVGSNPGCGTDGFPASPGWDPVTGLGTPNFSCILDRFLILP
ncbi:subtilisin-like protein [Ganoderma leucocontextum]|nr:subtilisin-like protein [Ganoderma leucocontextum]